MNLDKRLSAVAALLRDGKRLADIGTDHAYLPVAQVAAGKCPAAIASDIGQGPLEAARHTVTAAGMQDAIDLRLGDGLATVAPHEAEDIAIAGMGGETIVAILQAASWIKDPALRLVLQPMTRAEELRRWLLTNGFTIVEEHLVEDGRHLYPVLAAEYTGQVCAEELPCYAGFFPAEEGRPYRRLMAEHLRRRAAGLRHGGQEREAARLTALAEELDRL